MERLVCAAATSVLLNAFAPSSDAVGAQARALAASRGRAERPHTFFLRRTDPFALDGERLLTAVSYGQPRDPYAMYERKVRAVGN